MMMIKITLIIGTALCLAMAPFDGALAQQTSTILDTTGEVADSDARDSDNSPYDDFVVTLPATTRIRVTVNRVEPFDPNVQVLSPDGQIITYNDDAAGDLNALARFTTTNAGQYRFRVRGLGGGTGQYRIMAENLGPGIAPPPPRRITGNQTGRFTDRTTPSNGDGNYYVDYRVRLNAGQELVFNLDSDDFDALIAVFGEADMATMLASNDDSNNTRNSTLVFVAPTAGNYIVRASQLAPAEGNYRLRVRRLAPF
jgi:hypothetical protein